MNRKPDPYRMNRKPDPFDSQFFRDARKSMEPSPAAKVGIALWAAFCVLLSLAGVALVFWAVITIVQWLVTK